MTRDTCFYRNKIQEIDLSRTYNVVHNSTGWNTYSYKNPPNLLKIYIEYVIFLHIFLCDL